MKIVDKNREEEENRSLQTHHNTVIHTTPFFREVFNNFQLAKGSLSFLPYNTKWFLRV